MEQLSFEITAELNKLTKGLDRASAKIESFAKRNEKRLKDFGEKAGRIGQQMSIGLTLPLVALGTASVKAASDFEETESKFNTVFKNIQKDANETADELRNAYGLSSKASLQLLSDTGDLLTGFGFTQQSALELSSEVNKLAVDLASFTNFSGGAEGASQALTKALLGERESVKSLGISILETDVQAKVLENTQKGLTFESNRQAKAFATLQIAQEQSKNAIGDYARTSKSFANQTRLLQSRISELGVEFGKILLPTAQKIVKATQGLVKWFSELDDQTKTVITVVAGLVAAAGPLLVIIGGIASAIPALLTGFAAITSPIGLTVGAIALLIAGLISLRSEYAETGNKLSILSQIRSEALQSIAKEKSQVELLIAIAKDENFSKERRIEAIKELNQISPKYLGNLDLESVKTDKARIAIENYNKAVERRAIVKAAEIKLQELAEKKIQRELEYQQQLEKNKQAEIDLSKKSFDNALAEEAQKRMLSNANEINQLSIESANKEYEKERDLILGIIKNNSDLETSINSLAETRNKSTQGTQETSYTRPSLGQIDPLNPDNNLTRVITDATARLGIETALMEQRLQEFNQNASNIIQNGIANTFAGIGEAIGNALINGGNIVQSLGATLLAGVGQIAVQLGKQAIAIGTGLLAIQSSFSNPLSAIAAGVALVAIGSIFSNVADTVGQVGSGGGVNGNTGSSVGGGGVNNNFSQTFTGNREIILRARGRDLVAVLNAQTNFNNVLG